MWVFFFSESDFKSRFDEEDKFISANIPNSTIWNQVIFITSHWERSQLGQAENWFIWFYFVWMLSLLCSFSFVAKGWRKAWSLNEKLEATVRKAFAFLSLSYSDEFLWEKKSSLLSTKCSVLQMEAPQGQLNLMQVLSCPAEGRCWSFLFCFFLFIGWAVSSLLCVGFL